MKEVTGDIWDYYDQGHWIVITTNGTIKKNGACVMGKGIALQAAERFPYLSLWLGSEVSQYGNTPKCSHLKRLLTFPTKHNWWEKSDITLIEESCKQLVEGMKMLDLPVVYMVRPGCNNGQLDWKDVKPILEKYLDDRYIIVERSRE